ncbi:MAG: Fic family protein [Proteobacteria bacterium]|nr:Fic family protein [Pseudomonadota bacterium]
MKHLENIPAKIDLEKDTIKKLISANIDLAEFRTLAKSIPNEEILIETLPLLESKESSEIEQIVTTHDDIFRSPDDKKLPLQAKEVQKYAEALRYGYEQVKEKGMITTNLLIKIYQIVEGNQAGIRKIPSTDLKNEKGETVYTPPQNYDDIIKYMSSLEKFINSEDDDYDPLIKMTMIHYYFETIHPFHDGNGRVGRILNILFLVKQNLLDTPILYLSGAIISNKSLYYEALKVITDFYKYDDCLDIKKAWSVYLNAMLGFISNSSLIANITILKVKKLMLEIKRTLKDKEPNIYSHELINTIFVYPYVKTEDIMDKVGVSRPTATRYLKKLEVLGLLKLSKIGKINYYVNTRLMDIFKNIKY